MWIPLLALYEDDFLSKRDDADRLPQQFQCLMCIVVLFHNERLIKIVAFWRRNKHHRIIQRSGNYLGRVSAENELIYRACSLQCLQKPVAQLWMQVKFRFVENYHTIAGRSEQKIKHYIYYFSLARTECGNWKRLAKLRAIE